jgi:hypothetical protein
MDISWVSISKDRMDHTKCKAKKRDKILDRFCMFWFIKDGFMEFKIKYPELTQYIINAINHVMKHLTCYLKANGLLHTITIIIQNIS